jgi:NAD(P)-dependent dehydrogenase (short-subunit alcohol dehydrogenase family)
MKSRRTWLVTGSSRGLGQAIATAALLRGDNVALASRDPARCAALVARFPDNALAVALDVADPDAAPAAVGAVEERFGGLDVLVNNAAFAVVGAIEEVSRAEYQEIFEVNLFGAIEAARAALPLLRKAPAARILNISSIGGMVGSARWGYYCSTKFALEGLSEALAREVAPFGIAVIIVEPGRFDTAFSASAITTQNSMPEYRQQAPADAQPLPDRGDPARAAEIILKAVDMPAPPLRLPLGADAYQRIMRKLQKMQGEIASWEAEGSNTAYRR